MYLSGQVVRPVTHTHITCNMTGLAGQFYCLISGTLCIQRKLTTRLHKYVQVQCARVMGMWVVEVKRGQRTIFVTNQKALQ